MTHLKSLCLRQGQSATIRKLIMPQTVLIQVIRGQKELSGGGVHLTINPQEFVLMPAGIEFVLTNIPDNRGLYEASLLALPAEALERGFARLGHLQRPTQLAPQKPRPFPKEARNLLNTLFQASQDTLHLPPDIIDIRTEELALWLAHAGVILPANTKVLLRDRLRHMISQEPSAEWSATHAADHLAKSPATLRRHLATEGTSFSLLLRDTRLTIALEMLQSTPFSIARIASEVGYASPQQFAARFRERFGLLPREVRLKNHKMIEMGL